MASPQLEVIFIFDANGDPLGGQTPTFVTYKDDTGSNLSQPSISELGGGAYAFTPVFPPNTGIVYVASTGAYPITVAKYMRPEDFNVDNSDIPTSDVQAAVGGVQSDVTDLRDVEFGDWKIFTEGADANKLILYRPGGAVLASFDLFEADGTTPTSDNPFWRIAE